MYIMHMCTTLTPRMLPSAGSPTGELAAAVMLRKRAMLDAAVFF
jgi:hypothetical protein